MSEISVVSLSPEPTSGGKGEGTGKGEDTGKGHCPFLVNCPGWPPVHLTSHNSSLQPAHSSLSKKFPFCPCDLGDIGCNMKRHHGLLC